MTSLKTLETIEDGRVERARAPVHIDASMFLGSWTSTNRDTQGIARLLIRDDGGQLAVRGFGACVPSLCDWGEARADVFADSPDSTRAYSFVARFDHGFKETSLQAKVEKGVLVVANFNRFKDGSGRANYFSREFFFRLPAGDDHVARSKEQL